MATTALDELAQHGTEPVAALLVIAMEIVRHFDFHDRAVHLDGAREARTELDLGDRLAQRPDELGEGLARHGLGVLPGRRPHEGKTGRQWWLRRGHRSERRTGEIGRAHIPTPLTATSPLPPS